MDEIDMDDKVNIDVNELDIDDKLSNELDIDDELWNELDIDDFIIRSYLKHPTDTTKSDKETEKRDVCTQKSSIIQTFGQLPDEYSLDSIPDLIGMNPSLATKTVADLLGISDDETNLKSFWIVDTLTHCLIEVQKKGMQQSNKKALIHWFFYILKTISVYNWSREETFYVLKMMFLRAEQIVLSKSDSVPAPKDCSKFLPRGSSSSEIRDEIQDGEGENTGIANETNLTDLGVIIDVIYSVFANRFKYEVIRKTFSNITRWETIEIPNAINVPKTLQLDIVVKPVRKGQQKKDMIKTDVSTAETTESQKNSNRHILPLIKAVDGSFFDQLFPVQQNISSGKKNKTNEKKKTKTK